MLKEAFRVLKPGGRFAVSDVVVRGNVPAEIKKNMELWVGCVAGALSDYEYVAKLAKAGFDNMISSPHGLTASKTCEPSSRVRASTPTSLSAPLFERTSPQRCAARPVAAPKMAFLYDSFAPHRPPVVGGSKNRAALSNPARARFLWPLLLHPPMVCVKLPKSVLVLFIFLEQRSCHIFRD